jgi:hypothetical protein
MSTTLTTTASSSKLRTQQGHRGAFQDHDQLIAPP